MRQVITEEDLPKIIGRWIVQLDETQENFSLIDSKNDGFWLEKRISFIGTLYGVDGHPHIKFESSKESLIIMNGIYYTHGIHTPKDFVDYFNNGYQGKKERFHRLLTSKELDWLNEQLKKNNY